MKQTTHLLNSYTRCAAAAALLFSVSGCEVKKTQDAKAPEVKIEGGQMPKYDVDTAKVSVDTQKKEVTVPKVTTEQKTITVPDVHITMPGQQAATATPAVAMTPAATTTPAP